MKYQVAIDGPSGAGKSSIAKLLAQKLGIIYLDTGALYRSIALYMLENNINVEDEKLVCENLDNINIDIEYINGAQKVLLNKKDVSELIRENRVSLATSKVSAYKKVREFLLETQREIANENSVLMDGRDIGTVVLPCATVKIFMVASPEIRAKRRMLELSNKGEKVEFCDILEDINKRDYNDINRKEAPLKKASDAIEVVTDDCTIDEVLEKIIDIIKEKAGI